jgi:heme/copper-type cytochrome/quinol oxidase subunit 2
MYSKLKSIIFAILIMAIGSIISVSIGWFYFSTAPAKHNILIKARQYAFEPSVIKVNRGDTLHIKIISLDVVHGFFVEGYNIDAEIFANQKKFNFRHPYTDNKWQETDELVIITNRTGKFRYRCSHSCGSMHPFMQGELVVQPNTLYQAGIGSVFGLFVGVLWIFIRREKI